MIRYRLRIVLLSMGVVLGFGSALFHFSRGHGHHGSCVDDVRALRWWSQ
jgi:hypothetical protein